MGTGYHGGFGGTNGDNQQKAPVSSPGDVRYSKKKTEGYLLNPNHPKGGPKAIFMRDMLGYTQADSKLFHKNMVSAIMGKQPNKTETTRFGIKHTYHTTLIGINGKAVSANVVVVIQKDNRRVTYKIVTVYPGKKGGKQ
ncbi:MAG: hypothetical protein IJS31_03945 [Oscillospiraceae bacterium]|nr:hypothetical protein [Oscillospiraceae bacterium]